MMDANDFSDDDGPPVLERYDDNGPPMPSSPTNINLVEQAMPLNKIFRYIPEETTVASSSGANKAVRRSTKPKKIRKWTPRVQAKPKKKSSIYPEMNIQLDPELFDGTHFNCLSAAQMGTGRFKAYRFIGLFVMDHITDSPYPDDELKRLFEMCLIQAKTGAEGMKIRPNHYIFLLSSRYLDYEISVHLKKLDEAAIEKILINFDKVDQSNRGKEHPSICEDQFTVDVTAVETKDLKKNKDKMAGKGGRCRREYILPYNIHQGATYGLENDDNYCLFRAFEYLRMKNTLQHQRFSEYTKNEQWQQENVEELLNQCEIDEDREFYSILEYGDIIQNYYNRLHPGKFRLFCFETSGDMKPSWKSNVDSYEIELCVLFTDGCEEEEEEDEENFGHYDAIKIVGRLFKQNAQYCFGCEMPYHRPSQHNAKCKWKCKNCQRVGKKFRGNCASDGYNSFSCLLCYKTFKSIECFDHHNKIVKQRIKRGKETKIIEKCICKSSKKCVECGIVYRIVDQDKKDGHVCGRKFCRRCFGFHEPRECFMRHRPKEKRDKRFVFFDFECTTDFRPDPELLRFKHEVNFCYAHVTCTQCIEKGIWDQELEEPCKICGEDRFYSWAPFGYDNTDVDLHTEADDPLAAFTDWLLHFEEEVLGLDPMATRKRKLGQKPQNLPSTIVDDDDEDEEFSVTTYAYAHAGSRYDHVLIFGEILRTGIVTPTLIRQGNRLMEMKGHKKGKITSTVFRDSFNLIHIKLADFIKTFGLNIEGKINYENVLDTLPPIQYYHPGAMFPKERIKFEQWYEANKNQEFDLREVIADYCKIDVQILAHGVLKMMELFKEQTGDDITDSITMPSACMKYFICMSELEKQKIAIIPHLGYEKRGKQSTIARKFLKWLAKKIKNEDGYTLRHVESPGGEFHFNNKYWLDGYVERPDMEKDLVFEVNGCFWHGCEHCIKDEEKIISDGRTAKAIRERDEKRLREIREEFEVKVVWECHINQMLEEDIDMKAEFDNMPDTGPIEFPHAFFGAGPEWLGATIIGQEEDRTMKVKDFSALYPSRQFVTNYPVTHPTVAQYDKEVNWRTPDDMVREDGTKIEGIIKGYIVPPRHVHAEVSVLPLRNKNRTLFPLCRKCSEKFPKGAIDPNYNCPHFNDEERGFTFTFPHIEVEEALRAGYRVTKLYRAYEWLWAKDWCNNLFQTYIAKFLKIKYEASGYPSECFENGVDEIELNRRKQKYIDTAWERYRIRLDPAKIVRNEGLRFLAKLCLNSLWGRFALRNKLSKTEIIDNHCDLAKILNDDTIEISLLEQLTKKFWMVCYKTKDEHIVEHGSSNVVLALWTTSSARIHLLQSLQKVHMRDDARILYMDTDSIFYDYNTAMGDPLPSGEHMGELIDEYPNHKIVEFVCAGPKAYSLWLENTRSGEDEFVQKMRSITLDTDACKRINHERTKEIVINTFGRQRNEPDGEVVDNHKNFVIQRVGTIHTVPMKKRFNPCVNKGVVRECHGEFGFRVVQFGYSDWEFCKENNPNDCVCKNN